MILYAAEIWGGGGGVLCKMNINWRRSNNKK